MANRSRSRPGYSRPHLSSLSICSSPSASPFPIRYSPFAIRFFHSPTPDEERAERRWRSDACEAPVSACHDRHADASSICANRANPPCVLCAPRADPACDRFAQTGQTSPACMRRLAFPATGRSPFGAPRGISGPGPCSPLSGSPPRIVRRPYSTHGSSLPGGAGLANLPGAAANRLRGRHSLAPPCRIASRRRPS